MRYYDRYIKERQYYNKFGVCKHAEECQRLNPQDFESCPGFDGYLCTLMRDYYLNGMTPKTQRPKAKHISQQYNVLPISYACMVWLCIWGTLGFIAYGLTIAAYGLVGLVFGAEPFICMICAIMCHYRFKKASTPDCRNIWMDRGFTAIGWLAIGVFVAYGQIPYWLGHDVDVWLWFVTATFMLAPFGYIMRGYLNYQDYEQRKKRRIK